MKQSRPRKTVENDLQNGGMIPLNMFERKEVIEDYVSALKTRDIHKLKKYEYINDFNKKQVVETSVGNILLDV